MAWPVSDTFTGGVNGDPITTYSSNWIIPSYSAADVYISGERIYGLSGTVTYWTETAPSGNVELTWTTYVRSTALTNAGCGVVARASSSAATFYHARFSRVNASSANLELLRFVNGTATAVGTPTTYLVTGLSQGSSLNGKLKVTTSGANAVVEVFYDTNPTPVITYTDTAPLTGTYAGVRFVANNSSTVGYHFDNFTAAEVVTNVTLPVGLATETDTALQLTQSGQIAVGMATETDTAFALSVVSQIWTEYEKLTDHAYSLAHSVIFGNNRLFCSTVQDTTHKIFVHRMAGASFQSVEVADYLSSGPADIHNGGSVALDANGYVCVVSTRHGSSLEGVNFRRSATPYGLDFGAVVNIPTDSALTYYPNLIWFQNKLFLFANRGPNRDVHFRVSTDSGTTWSAWTGVFAGGSGSQPYYNVTEVNGELVLLASFNNAQGISLGSSSGYFMRYDGANWKRASGATISLPGTPANTDKFYDAATTLQNVGFSLDVTIDGAGRFVAHVGAYRSTTEGDSSQDIYMCRYEAGAWTQTLIPCPGTAWVSTAAIDPNDPYRFLALCEVNGHAQLFMVWSQNQGASWNYEQKTTGTVTRQRAAMRKIYGATDKWVTFNDQVRSGSTTWSSDIRFLINATTLAPATAATITLTSNGTNSVPNLTALKWAFFDQPTPANFGAPVAQGSSETTDANGVLSVNITGSTLMSGDTGYLIVTDTDGTTTQNPPARAFSGPVTVA